MMCGAREAAFDAALVRGTATGSQDPRRSDRNADAQLVRLQASYGFFWTGGGSLLHAGLNLNGIAGDLGGGGDRVNAGGEGSYLCLCSCGWFVLAGGNLYYVGSGLVHAVRNLGSDGDRIIGGGGHACLGGCDWLVHAGGNLYYVGSSLVHAGRNFVRVDSDLDYADCNCVFVSGDLGDNGGGAPCATAAVISSLLQARNSFMSSATVPIAAMKALPALIVFLRGYSAKLSLRIVVYASEFSTSGG